MRRLLLPALLALSGCSLVYKMDLSQGNLIDQEMVDQLKPGMSKRQVELVMGTAQLASPFNQDRWDYVSSASRRGRTPVVKSLTLYFDADVLARIEGDWEPQVEDDLLKQSQELQKNIPRNNLKNRTGG
jgi:outer membrane protein assembly factor BamE